MNPEQERKRRTLWRELDGLDRALYEASYCKHHLNRSYCFSWHNIDLDPVQAALIASVEKKIAEVTAELNALQNKPTEQIKEDCDERP